MTQPALQLLHQELRKSFRTLDENRTIWRTLLDECVPLMSSLGNLVEQLKALRTVDLSNTPLSPFPHLHQRLHLRLLHALDTVLEQLREKMEVFQSVRDSLCNQLPVALQVYEQNSDSLRISSCVARSALSPSIADMLEWLQDAEHYYRIQYIQRKNLLESLKPDDLTLMESVPKRWASLNSPIVEDRISDALFQVAFFMETE